MDELPTSPFPELHPLDQKRPLPSMADLLRRAQSPGLPVAPDSPSAPEVGTASGTPPDDPVLEIPRFPAPSTSHPSSPANAMSPESPEQPEAVARPAKSSPDPTPAPSPPPSVPSMPVEEEEREESMQETIAALLAEGGPRNAAPDDRASSQTESADPPEAADSDPEPAARGVEGTDAELAEAVAPILELGVSKALRSPDHGIETLLEPMLRSTVRRAIAEQMETSRQFRPLGAFDRLAYRLVALFSSRTYDDIVFDRTHRYQVEEVYLVRRQSRTLISYAHHDPGCHVSPRRVQGRVRELIRKLQAPDGGIESSFDLSQRRLALVREGAYTFLIAVLRGRSNALVRADLDYVLRQAEDRFGDKLEHKTDAFLRVLQPILEGCLLIQSPAPPH